MGLHEILGLVRVAPAFRWVSASLLVNQEAAKNICGWYESVQIATGNEIFCG